MTYQDSLALAQAFKDFVTPIDRSIWIYFIFSSKTDFTLKYLKNPDTHTRALLQWESIQKDLPLAGVCWNDDQNDYIFGYIDSNVRLKISPQSSQYIFLSCDQELRDYEKDEIIKETIALVHKSE